MTSLNLMASQPVMQTRSKFSGVLQCRQSTDEGAYVPRCFIQAITGNVPQCSLKRKVLLAAPRTMFLPSRVRLDHVRHRTGFGTMGREERVGEVVFKRFPENCAWVIQWKIYLWKIINHYVVVRNYNLVAWANNTR